MSYSLGITTEPEKPRAKIAGVAGAMFIWMIPLALYFLLKKKVRA